MHGDDLAGGEAGAGHGHPRLLVSEIIYDLPSARHGGAGVSTPAAPAARRRRSPRAADEAVGECLRRPGEQGDVGPDEHEGGTGREVAVGRLGVEGVDAGGLADLDRGPDRVQHRLDHLGVVLPAEPSHRGGEVGGADEDPVDAVDRGDLGHALDGGRGLDLHEERDRARGIREVAGHPVPSRRARERAAHAAHAQRRVAHRPHDLGGLLGGVDHRHEEVLHAEVEVLLDDHRVAERRTHERRDRVGGHGVQLREDRLGSVRGVLGVDEHDVEPAARGDLGVHRAARADPHARERAIGCREPRRERRRQGHSNRHVTVPNSR